MGKIYKDIPGGKEEFNKLNNSLYDYNLDINISFNMGYDSILKNTKNNEFFIESKEDSSKVCTSFDLENAIRLRDNLTKMIDMLLKLETTTREMTIKDIEKELGYSIKIIRED